MRRHAGVTIMNTYCHHISGFFSHKDQADAAYLKLVNQGFEQNQLVLRRADSAADLSAANHDSSNNVLKTVMINIAIGAAVGAMVGALVEIALTIANVDLFVASPLIAPAILIGWGLSFGGFIGGVVGVMKRGEQISALTEAEILNDQYALVVETHNRKQTSIAKALMTASVGGYKNVRDAKVTAHHFE